jgi:hypothetical protein
MGQVISTFRQLPPGHKLLPPNPTFQPVKHRLQKFSISHWIDDDHPFTTKGQPPVDQALPPDTLFPHTQRLLCGVFHDIAADNDYVARVLDGILSRIWNDLLKSEAPQPGVNHDEVERFIHGSLHGPPTLTELFKAAGGLEIYVASDLEQPEFGAVIWGLTTVHRNEKADSELVPAFNWSLCEAYEETVSYIRAIATHVNDLIFCSLPKVEVSRAVRSLGPCLLHGLLYTYVRRRLKPCMSYKALWSTPDLEGFEGKSGRELEKGILQGSSTLDGAPRTGSLRSASAGFRISGFRIHRRWTENCHCGLSVSARSPSPGLLHH